MSIYNLERLASAGLLLVACLSIAKVQTAGAAAAILSAETTTVAISSSLNPATYGQSITWTATVSAATTPAGTVTFWNGTAKLGTAPLAGGSASFSSTGLRAGTDSVTAAYNGDAKFLGSTSPVLSQVVSQAPTTIALTSSANPSAAGQPVTFTATVSSAATPTGPVTFKNGTAQTLTLTPVPAGSVSYILSAAAFNPSSVAAGSASVSALSVYAANGYIGSVNLSCSATEGGSPIPGCAVSPPSVTVSGSAPVAVQHVCQPQSINGMPTCTGPGWTNNVIIPQTQVLTDIAAGQLAEVSWVIPTGVDSDHDVASDGSGPSWVASIVNAIGNSQYWANTTIIVTWDDWGGWYDHVAPPIINDGVSWGSGYAYGFRVPLIVISPYAKPGYISHVQHDFGSILKYIETTFNLPTIGYADVQADDLSDCFDFSQPPNPFQTIQSALDASFFIHDKRPVTPPDDD